MFGLYLRIFSSFGMQSLRIFLNEKSFLLIVSTCEFLEIVSSSPKKYSTTRYRDVPAYGQIFIPFFLEWYLFNMGLKATFHLKRVIVTPAVYQLFTPLKRSLKYWHWAGVAFYTRRFHVAES